MDCLSHLSNLFGSTAQSVALRDPTSVDVLCLGSGWTYTFLGTAAADAGLKSAFTSRTAKSGGIVFTFDPESDDVEPFRVLPDAKTVVIIFPLYSKTAVRRLVRGYLHSRQMQETEKEANPHFVLLGSTGIWDRGPTLQFAPLSDQQASIRSEKTALHQLNSISTAPYSSSCCWKDRHSEVSTVPRAIAENEMLSLNKEGNSVRKSAVSTSVLCLCGLWGHGRSPRRYITLLAPTKEKLKALGSVHFIHGHDVARAIIAMAMQQDKAEGQRWLLTNERVYDLWDLCSRWGNGGEAGRGHFPQGPQPGWVQELIAESRCSSPPQLLNSTGHHGPHSLPPSAVRSLPRTIEQMGLGLDGTDFWTTFGLAPDVPWVD